MFISDNKYVDNSDHIMFSYLNTSDTYELEGKRRTDIDTNSMTVGLFARSDNWVF